MTTTRSESVQGNAASHGSETWWALRAFVALAVFVCSGFTATASAGLLLFALTADETGGIASSVFVLLTKAVVFALLATVAVICLVRLTRHRVHTRQETLPTDIATQRHFWPLVLLLMGGTIIAGARLDKYPHMEPDEAHHLIVARNLAFHGVYGSGMPAGGFRAFDDYDSVGPTVLAPVAASMRLLGAPFVPGRAAMAAFFLLLLLSVYFLFAQILDRWSGFAAASVLIAAPGSLYLSRTLYGEAPALAFLMLSLLAWNQSLASRRPALPAILAGIALGCALITKYFLIVMVWPALGVLLFDALTRRSIRPLHVLLPAGIAGVVVALWISVTSLFGPNDVATSSIAMYQHNLMFGFPPATPALEWLTNNWIPTLLFLCAAIPAMAVAVLTRHYSPALLFLVLVAVFNTFWWIFFTPGNIPRYLWYGFAIGAAITGAHVVTLFRVYRSAQSDRQRRLGLSAALIAVALILCSFAPRLVSMSTRDEMADERALVGIVQLQFPDKSFATTFYPVDRLLNLFAEVPVTRLGPNQPFDGFDAVIVDLQGQGDLAAGYSNKITAGRYAIIGPVQSGQRSK